MICVNSTIANLAIRDAAPVVHDDESKGDHGEHLSKTIGFTTAVVAGSVLLGVGVYYVWRYFAKRQEKKREASPNPASVKMVRVKLAFPVALVSRQDSGPKPIPDEVVGVTVGLIVLSVVGLIWLNVLIWKRAHRKAVEAVSAA